MENFNVNLTRIAENRQPGVSGMMRVKNDAEFIEACVLSCIDALDELVIVYNDCTDNSPAIIEEMRSRFPTKIRTFHYTPHIKAWNLTESEISDIFSGAIPTENTLAGYYNFALSKTTREYVMKIDADQLYFTPKLKELCDAYRLNSELAHCSLRERLFLFTVFFFLTISFHTKKYIPFLYRKSVYERYQRYLLNFIRRVKPDTSMSGVNVIVAEKDFYISLGKITEDSNNILPPFNGEGDHPIFKVTSSVRFISILDQSYNRLNGCNLSVIEKIVGLRKLWIVGPTWLHLNGSREKNFSVSLLNKNKYPQWYIRLAEFRNFNYSIIDELADERLFRKSIKKIFKFISLGVNKDFINFSYDSILQLLLRNDLFKMRLKTSVKTLNEKL